MEMSYRIHFWYQIWLKMLIFLRKGKKSFFFSQKMWQAKKSDFELKMVILLGNHVKTLL